MSSELKKQKKAEILDAALDIFSQNSFECTKVEDIARLCGIGKSTVYEYFKSKEDIFLAVLERGFADFNSQLRQIISKGSIEEKLNAYFRFTLSGETFKIVRLLMPCQDPGIKHENLREMAFRNGIRQNKLLTDMLKEAIESGELRKNSSVDALRLLIHSAVIASLGQHEFMNECIPEELTHTLLYGVAAKNEREKFIC